MPILALVLMACGPSSPGSSTASGSDSSPDASPSVEVELFAGGYMTCVLLDDGTTLRCWGRNDHGRCGMGVLDDFLGDDEVPRDIPSLTLPEAAAEVSMSTSHACARLSSGLECWGGAVNGALGFPWIGAVGDDESALAGPTVEAGGVVVRLIVAPDYVTCALLDGGGVNCWGNGDDGATGHATTEDLGDQPDEQPSSLPLLDLGGPARHLAGGLRHVCAAMVDGSVRCWGSDTLGVLGLGLGAFDVSDTPVIGDDEVPSSVAPVRLPGTGAIAVAAQARHVCSLHEGGSVTCWGETGPWLGYGSALDDLGLGYGDDEHPDALGHVDVGAPVTEIVVGSGFTCALLEAGDVRCWGRSAEGQLGYGNTSFVGYTETPAEVGVVSLGGRAIDIAAGWDHACAVLESGDVRCWGRGVEGVLGQGSTNHVGDDELPSDVPPIVFR